MPSLRPFAAAACALTLAAAPAVVLGPPAAAAAPPTCSAAGLTLTPLQGTTMYVDVDASPLITSGYEGFRVTNATGARLDDVWVQVEGFAPGALLTKAAHEPGVVHVGPLAAGASANAYFYLTAADEVASETHAVAVYPTRPDLAAATCRTSVTRSVADDIQAAANKVRTVVSGPTPPQVGGLVTVTQTGETGTVGGSQMFSYTPASYASWRADALQLVGVRYTFAGGNTATFDHFLEVTLPNPAASDYTAVATFRAVGTTAAPTTVSPMAHIASGSPIKHMTVDGTYAALAPIPSPVMQAGVGLARDRALLPPGGGQVAYTVTLTNTGANEIRVDTVDVALPSSPAVPTYVASSARYAGAAADDPVTSAGHVWFTEGFTVPAGSSRELTFDLAVPGTLGDYDVAATAAVGTTPLSGSPSVRTSVQPLSVSLDAPGATRDRTPTLTGTTNAAPGSTVTVTVDGDARTTTVDASGRWSLEWPVDLADGVLPVAVSVTDGSTATASGTVTVDATAPAVDVRFDSPPTDATPDVVGTTDLPDGASVSLAVGGESHDAAVSGGTFALTWPTPLADGPRTVTATARDAAGNEASDTDTITLDTTPPALAVTGRTTTDATPTLCGTTDAGDGALVRVTVDGRTATAAASGGAWCLDWPVDLLDGTYPVTAEVDDPAGNTARASGTLVVDTTLPLVTVDVATPSPDLTPAFSGLSDAGAGALVDVRVDGGAARTAPVLPDGTWALDWPVALTEGDHVVGVAVSDAAGNVGTDEAPFTVDRTAPAVDVRITTGPRDLTPRVEGTADVPDGSVVTLRIGGESRTAVVTGGAFALDWPTTLTEGPVTVTATVRDAAGNEGSDSDSAVLDATPPAVHVTAALTHDPTPTVCGTSDAGAGAVVAVTLHGQTRTAVVRAGGDWCVDWDVSLPDATYRVEASVTDAAGNTGTATASLVVDTSAPTIGVVTATPTRDVTPTFHGSTDAAPGSLVRVRVDGVTRTAAVTAEGTWSIDWPVTLAQGPWTVDVAVDDAAGNTGTASAPFVVDTTAPDVTVADVAGRDTTPRVCGTGEGAAGTAVTVVIGDRTATTALDADGGWCLDWPVDLPDGRHDVRAEIVDAAGNTGRATGTVTVDATAPRIAVTTSGETLDRTPLLEGTTDVPDGTAVTVAVGGTQQEALAADGAWSVQWGELAVATHLVTATVADAAGNRATATSTLRVVPTEVVVEPPAVSEGEGIVIAGTSTAPAGSPVLVTIEGLSRSTAVQEDATWSLTWPVALAAGRHEVEVTVTWPDGTDVTTTTSLVVARSEAPPTPPTSPGPTPSMPPAAQTGTRTPGQLPFTGSRSAGPLLAGGLALALVGGWLLVRARRRPGGA